MKKIILAILLFSILLSAIGCDLGEPSDEKTELPTVQTTTPPLSVNSPSQSQSDPSNTQIQLSAPLCCASNNGFDHDVPGTPTDYISHEFFNEMFRASIIGANKNSNGSYLAENGLALNITLVQDPDILPRSGDSGWANWYTNLLYPSQYSGEVKGTNISGPIGRGAYYVEIRYTDGSIEKFTQCNFANGLKKGASYQTTLDCNTEKELESVSIVIVYQILYEYWTWGMFSEKSCISDWRVNGIVNYT